MKYFFDAVRDQASNRNHLLETIKRRSNVHQKIQVLTNKKHFAKTIRQWVWLQLVYKIAKVIVVCIFLPSSINSKDVSYLPWQSKYFFAWRLLVNIKPKFFCELVTPRELTPCEISHICPCGINLSQVNLHLKVYFKTSSEDFQGCFLIFCNLIILQV